MQASTFVILFGFCAKPKLTFFKCPFFANTQTVVQKARCARLLYNVRRLHRSCTKDSLRSPFVQLRFCEIRKKNLRFAQFFFLTSQSRRTLAVIFCRTNSLIMILEKYLKNRNKRKRFAHIGTAIAAVDSFHLRKKALPMTYYF